MPHPFALSAKGWENARQLGNASYNLATTSGASLATSTQVAMVLEQTSPVQPVLQRADGSYVGTVSSTVGNFMIGFTSSGGTLWTGPNDTPQIATQGGGVIGASGTTYDANGNVTGQTVLPTFSWTGKAYQYGSTDQVADTPPAGGELQKLEATFKPSSFLEISCHNLGHVTLSLRNLENSFS